MQIFKYTVNANKTDQVLIAKNLVFMNFQSISPKFKPISLLFEYLLFILLHLSYFYVEQEFNNAFKFILYSSLNNFIFRLRL